MYLPYVVGPPGHQVHVYRIHSAPEGASPAWLGWGAQEKPFSSACGGGRSSTQQELEREAYARFKNSVNRPLGIFRCFFGLPAKFAFDNRGRVC
jgi:hypothetical protein